METVIERPTLNDQRTARESLPFLTEIISHKKSDEVSIQLTQGTSPVAIPLKALQLLAVILSSMAQGKAVSLIPADAEISTQQAADLLHVSRPHLVKLLETGVIPFKKTGSHRRIMLDDLLAYEGNQKKERHEELRFLAQQAQDLNLGYE